jgi:hypothetical protein
MINISVEVFLYATAAAAAAYFASRTREGQTVLCVGLCLLSALAGSIAVGSYFHREINADVVSWIKATTALTAAGLSMYETARKKEKKPISPRFVKGVAAALALVAVAGYFRFGDLGYSKIYHRWEFFHYYLGSKYDHELEYERLYKCTAVAQSELSTKDLNEVKARKLRDLHEDTIEPTQPTLDHPEDCKDRFTPERWEAFKADVKFFRSTSNLQYWNDMQKDHGYNPPPVWTIAGHFLSSLHPASEGYFQILALIDPLFFVGMFTAVFWAFGWRVCAVALILWGCQLPAEYFWTGGAFLRQDWIFLLVLSGCLIRKRYYALGGAAFAYSTLLRVFPGVLVAGWIVVAVTYFVKHKRFKKEHVRVAMGGILATVVLVSASIGVAGKDSYGAFLKHIRVHNDTPLTNHMGLKTMLVHSFDGRMQFTRNEKLLDPFVKWKNMRRDRFHAFFPLYVVMLVALGAAFIYIVRRVRSLWVAQALSLVLCISLVELTCYYYSMFILAAFLSRLRKGFEQAAFFAAGTSQLLVVNHFISYYYDDRYTAQSVVFFVYSTGILFAFWPIAKRAVAANARKTGGTGQEPEAKGSSTDTAATAS